MDNRLKKNFLYNLVYQIIIVIIPIFITPFIARTLGPKSLGIYDYCFSSATIVITVCLIGVGNYGNRQIAYIRDETEKLSNCFFSIMFLQFILAIIAIIVFLFVTIFCDYGNYMILFIILVIGQGLDCTWFYLGIEEMKYAVIKNIVAKLLYVFATILFVRSSKDLSMYIIFYGLSVLIANISAYKNLSQYIDFTINKKYICDSLFCNFCGALKLFLPVVTTQILLSIDKIILGLNSSDISVVSFYSNSEKIIQIPLALITVINAVMMPRLANEFSNSNYNNIKNYIINTAKVMLFFASPLMIGIFICSDYFIPWYLGDSFSSCIIGLKYLSPIVIGNVLIGITGSQYFVATNQTKVLFVSNVSSAMSNIILDVLLIPLFGLKGACVATVIAIYINVIIQYFIMSKQINIRIIITSLIKYINYSILMGAILFFFSSHMSNTVKTTIIQIIIGIASYILINYLFKDEMFKKIVDVFLEK